MSRPESIVARLARKLGAITGSGRAQPPVGTHFVICGDILSCTGYAKSARALASVLASFGSVLGVPLQVDPNDRSEAFPGDVIDRDALFALAMSKNVVVIHHATPEHFFVVPNALNVGFFYWETRSIPRDLRWAERIGMMDAIWAPTTFLADFAREAGYLGPIHLVPWVQKFGQIKKSPLPQVDVHLVEFMPGLDKPTWAETTSFERARNRYDFVALAIQSLAPRKGLQLLLDEWRTFLADNRDGNALLMLKLNFVHAIGIEGGAEVHLRRLLARYGFREGDRVGIGLINSRLSDAQIHALHQSCDVYVTASLGEGFGGPVVEALQEGTPVIAPRHTGITDLLPEKTPLAVPCAEFLVGLRDNIPVYPHSSYWNVIERGAMAKRLGSLMAMDGEMRGAHMAEQRAHADEFCGRDAVRRAVQVAVSKSGAT